MVDLSGGIVVGLLSLIATIDLAQFSLTLKQERRLSKVETKVVKNGNS